MKTHVALLSASIFSAVVCVLFISPPDCGAQSDNISIGALSRIYGPLKFAHNKHIEMESNCAACHHHSEQGATPPCASCHGPGAAGAKKGHIVGLKDAYHGLCINCHKKLSGPGECAGCHSKKNSKLDILYLKDISSIYEPVKFSHGKHIDGINDCGLCHHRSEGDKTPACKTCHETAKIYKYKGIDRKTALGSKGAYHGLCVGCHKKGGGPAECAGCHKRRAAK